MNGVQRRVAAALMALATAAGMAGAAGTASATEKVVDYNWHYERDLTGIDDPCTPQFDDITLDGDWHSVGKRWERDDGTWHYQGSVRSRLSGAAADGTQYGGGNHFRAQTGLEDGVISESTAEQHLLVSQGSASNFALNLRIEALYALDGTVLSFEVVKAGTDCRG